MLFLFSFNHKKIIYKQINGNIDFRKLRQYIYVNSEKSLYLMDNYLFIENTCFTSENFIDTGNIFLNEIRSLFINFSFLINHQVYRDFFITNDIINTILKEEPHKCNDLYLFNLKIYKLIFFLKFFDW